MYCKINSEYEFTRKISEDKTITLTVYIYYNTKTYDFMQNGEEGIFPRDNCGDTKINKAYFELALEILAFLDRELYNKK
jgi:hypothetical protein